MKENKMRSYKVQFYKSESEYNDKGKLVKTGKTDFLGELTVDDTGTNQTNTIVAKAFKQANDKLLSADKVVVYSL